MECPDDIMQVARETASDISALSVSSWEGDHTFDAGEAARIIAVALLLERKRCAELIRGYGDHGDGPKADAIMGGELP